MADSLTEAQVKALKIIHDHGPIRPREFAEKMWPDSPGWSTYTQCGNYGVTRGGGMNLAAGVKFYYAKDFFKQGEGTP